MIDIVDVSKSFGKIKALDSASCKISSGSVFGLVGSNGAGKSTLLRIISGVYKQDSGSVILDGQDVFDNPSAKKQCVFLSDDPYIAQGASLDSMAKTYSSFYDTFSDTEYSRLVNLFNLDPQAHLLSLSKGMRRQAYIVLAISCKSKYLIMDETLDGLDHIMRSMVKRLLYEAVIDNGCTVLISSHSLRELEDACDNIAMIHAGKIVFQNDIQDIGISTCKIQVVMQDNLKKSDFRGIEILNYSRRGSISTLIVRGDSDTAIKALEKKKPLLVEVLPLSLEEVFTYELRDKGYSFEEILSNSGGSYETQS